MNGFIKFLFLSLIIQCNLYSQEIEWVKSIGGTSSENSTAVVTDSNGFVYVTGYFTGTLDFDPSANVYNLTSNGQYDTYLAKYDASGSIIWAKNFGGNENDFPTAMAIDHLNNIYFTGFYSGTADFNPSNAVFNLTSVGFRNVFIVKLDSSGSFIWAKSVGGNSIVTSFSITTDSLGNVYTVGNFRDTADFNPSNASFNLSANAGVYDLFILKLNTNGVFLWAKKVGGIYDDTIKSITTDELGNIYTTGYFRGTIDFDPGNAVFNLSSDGIQNNDIFILKLNAQGDFVWAKRIGSNGQDFGESIVFDQGGDIIVTGIFNGIVDFDSSNGVFNLASAGSYDAYVLKMNVAGDFIWAKRFGGSQLEHAFSLATDNLKNIYITGYFEGASNFETNSTGSEILIANGYYDAFVLKLNAQGDFLYVKDLGGDSYDKGASVIVDNSNNVYVCGDYFDYTASYLQNGTTTSLSNQGLYDMFIMKINQQVLPTTTIETLCGETLTSLSQRINFVSVPNAQEYTFSITNMVTNATHEIITPNRFFRISEVPNYGFNMSFSVKGKVKVNGIYGSYGVICQIKTPKRYSQLRSSQCGQTLTRINETLRAVLVTGATSYKFRIENTQTIQELESTTGRIPLLSFSNIQPNQYYNVSVLIKVDDVWLPYFGEVCLIITPDLPTTQLRATNCDGSTTRLNQNFRANPISYAQAYRFRTTIGGNEVVVIKSTAVCNMTEFAGATLNQTYSIQVAMQFNGVWSEYGDACNWTVGTVSARLIDEEGIANANENFEIKAYPNPFENQITLTLSNENMQSDIMVYDMTGKLIQQVSTQENTLQIGSKFTTGVYLIQIIQGQETKNIRVAKQ